MTKDPNDFAPYAGYLVSSIWPSEHGYGAIEQHLVEDMPPNQAASCLAKLVRWARVEPFGDIAMHADEDSREEAVRLTRLGTALAARACNMTEEHFHAIYGEYGVRPTADPHLVLGVLAVSLEHNGLADWTGEDRITLSSRALTEVYKRFDFVERAR